MGAGPLTVELIVVFGLTLYVLHKYGNWRRQHSVVTAATLVAWYFSFIIIFVLPLDVSTTIYRECVQTHTPHSNHNATASVANVSHEMTVSGESTSAGVNVSTIATVTGTTGVGTERTERALLMDGDNNDKSPCVKPWSYVPSYVLPDMWRVVYWTSMLLTWLILPLMQSYTYSGAFTIWGKIRTALIENAIYYGTYLLIFGALLIYVSIKTSFTLDGGKLKVLCVTASNTWGLFLLVFLMGYGLVEIPRSCWYASRHGYRLHHSLFQLAKLSVEKIESEESLEDILDEIKVISGAIRYNNPLRKHLDTVLSKCPPDFQDKIVRQLDDIQSYHTSDIDAPTEKELADLHRKVMVAMRNSHRTHAQWNGLIEKSSDLEDIAKNEGSNERVFKRFNGKPYDGVFSLIYSAKAEWYWKCVIQGWLFQSLAFLLCIMSLFIIWSECTFFNKNPVLSLFAIFIDIASFNYHYNYIEVISCVTIFYLCFCVYHTVFKIRIFNYYYLSPHHETDENSLLFSGTLLCRLTPPICLNFLGLIHLDGLDVDQTSIETAYTQIMGHMKVMSFMSEGFYIYYPITIVVICIATFFSLGSRCLHVIGFQQFVGEDEMTNELVEEGKELLKRERRQKQRQAESDERRQEFEDRFGVNRDYGFRASSKYRRLPSGEARAGEGSYSNIVSSKFSRTPSAQGDDLTRVELLRDTEAVDYNDEVVDYDDLPSNSRYSGQYQQVNTLPRGNFGAVSSSYGKPPNRIFDDI